ncbi:MAG: pyridoxamine 5'-phosphate oxidase family protein [Anaerolineae bacterium]|nr:pyridoxamine 5'-phosphate oxidase family protein [Anaerolineae bacterium]
MTEFEQTPLNRVRRIPKRGQYDAAAVYAIVDEALMCHVGFVQDGRPFVIPTIHAREDDTLYLHGARTIPCTCTGPRPAACLKSRSPGNRCASR